MSTYGPLMININGMQLTPLECGDYSSWQLVSGYTLFKKNFFSAYQLTKLTQTIQNKREILGLPPALVAVDHEGGHVQRFIDTHFTPIPAPAVIGRLYRDEPTVAIQLMQSIALMSAAELGSCGINVLLGPVMDLTNSALGQQERSYSHDPTIITTLLRAYLIELKKHGLNAIGKHYPGLGAASVDTHLHFADIKVTMRDMQESHLLPFQSLLKSDCLAGVMLAHGVFSSIDPAQVPMSSFWIETMLRDKYQFDGVVMTDCLHMLAAQALGPTYSKRIINCMQRCDLVLLSHPFFAMKKVLQKLQSAPLFQEMDREKNQKRIVQLIAQTKSLNYYQDLMESKPYAEAKQVLNEWNNECNQRLVQKKNSVQKTMKSRIKKDIKKSVRWFLKYPLIRELVHKTCFYVLLSIKKVFSN